jgi:hypothetical protein
LDKGHAGKLNMCDRPDASAVSVQKYQASLLKNKKNVKGKIFRKAGRKPFKFLQHFHLIKNSQTLS